MVAAAAAKSVSGVAVAAVVAAVRKAAAVALAADLMYRTTRTVVVAGAVAEWAVVEFVPVLEPEAARAVALPKRACHHRRKTTRQVFVEEAVVEERMAGPTFQHPRTTRTAVAAALAAAQELVVGSACRYPRRTTKAAALAAMPAVVDQAA